MADDQTSVIVDTPEVEPLKLKPKRPRLIWWLVSVAAIVVVSIASLIGLYFYNLQPVTTNSTASKVSIDIKSGTSPDQIASQLNKAGLIRSELAFRVYIKLGGYQNRLQAGVYSLSPAEAVPQIVSHLVTGKSDRLVVTFLPGATIMQNRKVLVEAGYTPDVVDKALSAEYDHPLLRDKPNQATLEGYIFGETYHFSAGVSVEDILKRSFDEYYKALQANNIETGFKSQGFSLHQGIIMSSIVQREVPEPTDQKQVAQVFIKRYRESMPLGSDITAYYGADLAGLKRAVTTDTPYNTRIHSGLPPGPIASPGVSALQAVANPAKGDYLYFLSGDDEVTYFARTLQEHESNIVKHCRVKCDME